MKYTKKAFRIWLNDTYRKYPKYRSHQYHQLKREYGDYLYFQDRVRFDCYFEIFIKLGKDNPSQREFEDRA